MNDNLFLLAEEYHDNTVLRTLIKALPIGGIVDNTLANIYTKEKERRLKVFYNELANGSLNLTNEYINTDDFLHKYFITLHAVIETKRDEKIKFLARLLNNSESPLANTATDYYDDFLKALDELTYQELYILITLRKIEREFEADNKNLDFFKVQVYASLKEKLMSSLGISENEVYAILIRLERTGTVSFIRNQHTLKHHDSIITTDFFRKLSQLALID